MKAIHRLLLAACACGTLIACAPQENKNGWKLAWEETFDQATFDTAVWSKIPRGQSDWCRHMSFHPDCYAMKDGHLVLRGIMNPAPEQDTARFITGGLYTKDKKAFYGGRLEIRAKLQAAQGAWPAIWLMPYDKVAWPHGGEIDIMEHLNHDGFVYQTVHSNYTYNLGQKDNPANFHTACFNPEEFNVFGVDIHRDSVVFHVNGVRNFAYPRVEDIPDSLGQFPFFRPMYLLIDMQLGGSWVGETDPADLPVEMEVDWVRHYVRKD